MTRQCNAQFYCNNCKCWQTQESAFGRWIRNNSELASEKGFVVVDQDYCINKYKINGSREFQCLMWLEIKTFGADLTPAQANILHIFNQLVRNRRQTPTKDLVYQAGTAPLQCFSLMLNRLVWVKSFGIHTLTFSGMGPQDSEWIKWDGKHVIDETTLTALLAFDLDPDTLKPLDLKPHHQKRHNDTVSLFDAA